MRQIEDISPGGVPESHLPVEFLGRRRDDVGLLVIDRRSGAISSGRFPSICEYLNEGDLLVANNSALVKASFSAYFPGRGEYGKMNFGTSRKGEKILVEPRPISLNRTLEKGDKVELVGSGRTVRLMERHEIYPRFWWADPGMSELEVYSAMNDYGGPITYDHVYFTLPDEYYRTCFSRIPGSVELPSAALPFTSEVVSSLGNKGVSIRELTLHCNIGSLEPFEFSGKGSLLSEEFIIPGGTIDEIARTKERGGRVIAIGTTVVRALESYALFSRHEGTWNINISEDVMGIKGRTDLFIRPGFEFSIVDGLVTGMHDPFSSHIDMISAFAGPELLLPSYGIAVENNFLWHEFGDITMIL